MAPRNLAVGMTITATSASLPTSFPWCASSPRRDPLGHGSDDLRQRRHDLADQLTQPEPPASLGRVSAPSGRFLACVWLEHVLFELVAGLHAELAERLA